MFYNELLELGLKENEAKVYDSLLKMNSSGAGDIIKDTKLHRNIVYENLEKLIEKGLVSFILDGGIKIFQAEPPTSISDMVEERSKEIEKQKEIAQELKDKLEKLNLESEKKEATIYRGVKGVITVMNMILEQKNYDVLGAPQKSVDLMPPKFWEQINNKINLKKIKLRMIFNEELRDWSKNVDRSVNDLKFLPHQFDSLTQINICIDRVFIFIWSDEPLVIAIVDKELAKGYKQYFEFLWKIAKK